MSDDFRGALKPDLAVLLNSSRPQLFARIGKVRQPAKDDWHLARELICDLCTGSVTVPFHSCEAEHEL